MNGSCALTTFDNPYNPFEQFSDWFLFDVEKGYNTCAYLDRMVMKVCCFSLQYSAHKTIHALGENNERRKFQ